MCVIAYKAKDVRFPSEKNVREMWEHNPDGAGVMWRHEDGRIRYTKGFMKLKELEKWIERNHDWLEEVECALHFRITTHGGTSQGNCHPFVAEKDADPHSLSGIADRVLMHNGILPLIPREKDISDSAELALRIGEYSNASQPLATLNETLSGNRIILMDESGTHFFGDAFKKSEEKENDGILYSNLNHEKTSVSSFGWSMKNDIFYNQCGAYWDDKSGTFRDSFTNLPIDLKDVDPYDISEDDYEIWETMYYSDDTIREYCRHYEISPEEYRDLEIEADSCGMNIDDYIQMIMEDEKEFSESEKAERVCA